MLKKTNIPSGFKPPCDVNLPRQLNIQINWNGLVVSHDETVNYIIIIILLNILTIKLWN